jgi:hypothetical protein
MFSIYFYGRSIGEKAGSMSQEEFTVEKNTGFIAPVSADSSLAQVEDTKRKALAEQVKIKSQSEEANGPTLAGGHAEADLLLDIGLEALGLKSAATAAQIVSGRMADTAGTRNEAQSSIQNEVQKMSRAPGMYEPSIGEDLLARANIATDSLHMPKDHVNTEIWGGTDTKMSSVKMAKSLTFDRDIANRQVLDSVYAAEKNYSATLGHVRQMAPGMDLGSGPSINQSQLLGQAEKVSEMEDWQRRMAEQAGGIL